MHQFGIHQLISDNIDMDNKLHQFGLTDFSQRHWGVCHNGWIGYWQARTNSEVPDHPIDTHKSTDEYML